MLFLDFRILFQVDFLPGQLRLARDFHRGDLLGAGSYGHLAEALIFQFQLQLVPHQYSSNMFHFTLYHSSKDLCSKGSYKRNPELLCTVAKKVD